jgi:hypothetical protein
MPIDSLAYSRHRKRAGARQKAETALGRDIAPCPPVKDPLRRARADASFRFFCETYFPKLFSLAWSEDHLKVIAKIERAVVGREMFAVAMPRGSGKTTLCQIAVIWAIVTGRHPFVFLVASTQDYAVVMLENIKSHLSTNDGLLDEFPEVVYPIRCLEGQSRRCDGQTYYGKQTHIGWAVDEIRLATLPGSRASGAVIRVGGITSNIRGAVSVRPDGVSVRPSIAIVDDPQTDASARSLSQTAERLALVNGTIAGLAGPGKRIAILLPCTVIRAGDLADQLLDSGKNPVWQGERMKMLSSLPTNEKMWDEYAIVLADDLRAGGTGRKATEFYQSNREAMDSGAKASWEARYVPGEVSAIQHAMNLRIRDEAAFFAEYQNDPMPDKIGAEDEGTLTADQIAGKVNGYHQGMAPIGVDHLTAFVDIQEKMLFWIVCGWRPDFTGFVLDYGTYPDQKLRYFSLKSAKRTLKAAARGAALEGAIYAGLESVAELLVERDWIREDGARMRVGLCLVDANWGTSTDIVYGFCTASKRAAQLMPCHGRYVGASSKPFSEYRRNPGDKLGLNWRIPKVRGKRITRHVAFDTNFWKSFVQARLSMAMGEKSGLSLYGKQPQAHQLLSEHLTAEYRVKTEGRGRVVDEWKLRTGGADNHWLDGIVGCVVGASVLGCELWTAEGEVKSALHDRQFAEVSAAELTAFGVRA